MNPCTCICLRFHLSDKHNNETVCADISKWYEVKLNTLSLVSLFFKIMNLLVAALIRPSWWVVSNFITFVLIKTSLMNMRGLPLGAFYAIFQKRLKTVWVFIVDIFTCSIYTGNSHSPCLWEGDLFSHICMIQMHKVLTIARWLLIRTRRLTFYIPPLRVLTKLLKLI